MRIEIYVFTMNFKFQILILYSFGTAQIQTNQKSLQDPTFGDNNSSNIRRAIRFFNTVTTASSTITIYRSLFYIDSSYDHMNIINWKYSSFIALQSNIIDNLNIFVDIKNKPLRRTAQ